MAVALTLATAACAGSANGPGSPAGNVSPVKGLTPVTPAGSRPVSSVVWAITRDPKSLDAIDTYGYPENTADALMCESLLRQAPDGSLEPGLATATHPNPTTVVFTLRPGVKFRDGHLVTSADVVYSLERSASPKLGGLYPWVFGRVTSIQATGPAEVTIKLRQPDYWLEGELSSMAGVVIEKSFAKKEGASYGTPAGSIMCTGAYMIKSWIPGAGVVAVRNPHYWDPSVRPLVGQITLKGVPDIASLTSGLLTGALQGYYVANGGLPTLDQLRNSSTVKVYQSLGWQTEVFFVSSLKGVLGNLNVRRALSLALNRQAIINSVYHGAALLPRWLSNPGTFGYGTSVFRQAYDSSPVLTQDIAEARRLVRQAGAMLAQAVLPGGLQNFDNFNDPQITAALERARSTADPDRRAALVVEAEKLTIRQLPWIPDVQPTNVLLLSKSLTGAMASLAYLFAPGPTSWAAPAERSAGADMTGEQAVSAFGRGMQPGRPGPPSPAYEPLNRMGADAALSSYRVFPVERQDVLPLWSRLKSLHANLSAYDAQYVALAEALNLPLITADARIKRSGVARCKVEVFEAHT